MGGGAGERGSGRNLKVRSTYGWRVFFCFDFRHNDLPWNIRKFLHNRIKDFKFREDLRQIKPWSSSAWSHTDLPRLRAGHVSAQVKFSGFSIIIIFFFLTSLWINIVWQFCGKFSLNVVHCERKLFWYFVLKVRRDLLKKKKKMSFEKKTNPKTLKKCQNHFPDWLEINSHFL